MSDEEFDVLSTLFYFFSDFKYVARDKDGSLRAYDIEPIKSGERWVSGYSGKVQYLSPCNNVFGCVRWTNEKATEISGFTRVFRKKRFKVSARENSILNYLPKEYKYICRNKNGCLFVYEDRPYKLSSFWNSKSGEHANLKVFKNYFQYVEWDNEEPIEIEDLLNS